MQEKVKLESDDGNGVRKAILYLEEARQQAVISIVGELIAYDTIAVSKPAVERVAIED
jgi:hypothetical protein